MSAIKLPSVSVTALSSNTAVDSRMKRQADISLLYSSRTQTTAGQMKWVDEHPRRSCCLVVHQRASCHFYTRQSFVGEPLTWRKEAVQALPTLRKKMSRGNCVTFSVNRGTDQNVCVHGFHFSLSLLRKKKKEKKSERRRGNLSTHAFKLTSL